MSDIIEAGILPQNFLTYTHDFLATFDIESVEETKEINQTEHLRIEAHQHMVSIGLSTNVPGCQDKWFCRRSSSKEDGQSMMREFFAELEKIQEELTRCLPAEIRLAIEKLKLSCSENFKWKEVKFLRHLEKFQRLNVFGFNSGE